MSAVPTVVVVGQHGDPLIINEADFVAGTHTLWADHVAAAEQAAKAAEAEIQKAAGKRAPRTDA
jgi:hypothetical protein